MHHKIVRISLWLEAAVRTESGAHQSRQTPFLPRACYCTRQQAATQIFISITQTQLTDLFSWAKEKKRKKNWHLTAFYKADTEKCSDTEKQNWTATCFGTIFEITREKLQENGKDVEKVTSKRTRRTSHQINSTTNASLTQHQSLRHTKDMVDLSVNYKSWWHWKSQQKQKLGVCCIRNSWGNQ